ncbi:hypothetical protein DVA67_033470, partial [Solirubrobacter sp. CPCC 204708]|nr:hypothetical protein [Solirubrobacter deserti]
MPALVALPAPGQAAAAETAKACRVQLEQPATAGPSISARDGVAAPRPRRPPRPITSRTTGDGRHSPRPGRGGDNELGG